MYTNILFLLTLLIRRCTGVSNTIFKCAILYQIPFLFVRYVSYIQISLYINNYVTIQLDTTSIIIIIIIIIIIHTYYTHVAVYIMQELPHKACIYTSRTLLETIVAVAYEAGD